MSCVISVYKPIGTTPLQLISDFRRKRPEYRDAKISYAGRLDPMARGVMLLLVGEENKKRKYYENLPKEYIFEVLFGIVTDTYDILGKVSRVGGKRDPPDFRRQLDKIAYLYKGKWKQAYPPYSSVRVEGRPLFYWAREGKLAEVKAPIKEIEIYDLLVLAVGQIKADVLRNVVFERINRVVGDFRQREIRESWETYWCENTVSAFKVVKFRIACSSGTYVRSLAHEFGQQIGTGALALSILRIKVGEYSLEQALLV